MAEKMMLDRAKQDFDSVKKQYTSIKEKAEKAFKQEESMGILPPTQTMDQWSQMNYPQLTTAKMQLQSNSAQVMAIGRRLGPNAEQELQDYNVITPEQEKRGAKGFVL